MAEQNKTEQATPRQRKQARERGQVTRSRELIGALTLCAVAGVVYLMCREALPQWSWYFRTSLEQAISEPVEPGGAILFGAVVQTLRWVLPIFAAALLVSFIAGFAQGGLVIAPQSLAFKFDRMSPAGKLKQLFSAAGLSNVLKTLLPFSVIAWIGVASVKSHWSGIMGSSFSSARGFTALMGSILIDVFWKSCVVLLVWAAVDYGLLWWKNEGDLKMSRQDIKDEMKQTEGNPENKARMRRMARQTRRRQMLKATETATVVITNPTHYAVALRYEQNMPAPIVVAKGLDNLAQKIKEIAWSKEIPVMENRPLAQALYKTVEVGDPIPAALYHAVAEILVMIFKAQAEVRNREAQRKAPLLPKHFVRI